MHTIKKIDKVIDIISKQYEWLKEAGLILWFDESYTKGQLIGTYNERRKAAKSYLVN